MIPPRKHVVPDSPPPRLLRLHKDHQSGPLKYYLNEKRLPIYLSHNPIRLNNSLLTGLSCQREEKKRTEGPSVAASTESLAASVFFILLHGVPPPVKFYHEIVYFSTHTHYRVWAAVYFFFSSQPLKDLCCSRGATLRTSFDMEPFGIAFLSWEQRTVIYFLSVFFTLSFSIVLFREK